MAKQIVYGDDRGDCPRLQFRIDSRRSWLAWTERPTHIEPKFRLFPWARNPNR
jgi:hypothetical protein